ncbi:MAG: META domain-containing protein [Vitreimonas sp.]
MRNVAFAFSLLLAACASGPQGVSAGHQAADVTGAWKLASVAGAAVLSGTNPTLTLTADGHANGNGGCNGFGGSYTRAGDTLAFSQMISTMMACTRPGLTYEQVMGQEHHFLSALNSNVRASEPETNVLVLTTASGDALRFERVP